MQEKQNLYKKIEPEFKQDFLRWSSKQIAQQQYRVTSIPVHTHNNVDSPPILYSTLKNVKNYLVSNTVVLNSAQIKALHTTPITLVLNPGPRSFVFVEGIAGRLTYSGTAYTGTNNLEFRYTNAAGNKVCADMPAIQFLNTTTNSYSYSPFVVDYNRNVDSNFTPTGGDTGNNGQIVVCVPTANPATGNSSVTLIVYYRVVSFIT